MNHSAHFDATPGGLQLAQAILLYAGSTSPIGAPRKGSDAFASIHTVENGESGPVIAAGTPLTRAHLRQWGDALDRTAPPQILPERALVAHPDMLAWWVPAQVRNAYFDLSRPPAGAKRLNQRTCVAVPYPAHLFIATHRALGVYALPSSERPTADTRVLFSPILNVFINGTLCWGNITRPSRLDFAAMQDFEDAVFDSWSTHPNAGQEQTLTGKGGLMRLWDDLAARQARRFPVARLKPFDRAGAPRRGAKPAAPVTVGQLIAQGIRT